MAETEERVLRALAAGDVEGAATAVVREHGPEVARFLDAVLRDGDLAADVFSEWAVRVWKGIGGWRGPGGLRSWSFAVARNAALKAREQGWQARRRPLPPGDLSALVVELGTRTFARAQREADAMESLRAALTDDERALLALRIGEELDWEEVAAALGDERGEHPSSAALRKRFERIKRRLARLARERGLV